MNRYLKVDYSFALLKLTLIIVVLVYNWTEASFHGINNIWLLFFISVISVPEKVKDIPEYCEHSALEPGYAA